MDAATLAKFYAEVQQESPAVEEAAALKKSLQLICLAMRKEHDACFVCKETSSVPPPDLSKPSHSNVYQDMTLPLTCYYVASSHNTYLSGNQLTNASTAQAIENQS